jgi:broad specificity phosphatase PhoE
MTRPDVSAQIYLVRHGETDWNKLRQLQGSTDIPLNETGRQQAVEIRERLGLSQVFRIVSSPLKRARETAEIIAQPYGLNVETENGLSERSYGVFEGRHTSIFDEVRQILAGLPPEQRRIYQHVDEETEAIVLDRLMAALREIAQTSLGKTVVGVSHGSALGMLLRDQFDRGGLKSPHLTNTAVLHIESDGNTFELKAMHGVKDKNE